MSGLVGLHLKKTFGVPLAVTFHALGVVRQEHQGPNDGFPPVRAEIERAIVRDADRVIAECPQDEADLIRLYQARGDRITTVPCGDVNAFSPGSRAEARRAVGIADDEFVILQLGRMVPSTGQRASVLATSH